jgi:hypothetical protein
MYSNLYPSLPPFFLVTVCHTGCLHSVRRSISRFSESRLLNDFLMNHPPTVLQHIMQPLPWAEQDSSFVVYLVLHVVHMNHRRVMVSTCIRNVPGSSLCWVTGYPENGLSSFLTFFSRMSGNWKRLPSSKSLPTHSYHLSHFIHYYRTYESCNRIIII